MFSMWYCCISFSVVALIHGDDERVEGGAGSVFVSVVLRFGDRIGL